MSIHDGSDVSILSETSKEQCHCSTPQDEEDANFTLDDGQAQAPPSALTSAPADGQVSPVPMATAHLGQRGCTSSLALLHLAVWTNC